MTHISVSVLRECCIMCRVMTDLPLDLVNVPVRTQCKAEV